MRKVLLFFLIFLIQKTHAQYFSCQELLNNKKNFVSYQGLIKNFPKAKIFASSQSFFDEKKDFVQRIENTLQDFEHITQVLLPSIDLEFYFGEFGGNSLASVCHLTTTVLINTARWDKALDNKERVVIDIARISLFHELVHVVQNINPRLNWGDKENYSTEKPMLEREQVAHFFEALYFYHLYGADAFSKYYFEKLTGFACPVKNDSLELHPIIQSRWDTYAYFLQKFGCMPKDIFQEYSFKMPLDKVSSANLPELCENHEGMNVSTIHFKDALQTVGIDAFVALIKNTFKDYSQRRSYSSYLLENVLYSAGELNLIKNPPRSSKDLSFDYLDEVDFGINYLTTQSYKKMSQDRALKADYYKKVKLYYIARYSFFHALDMWYTADFSYAKEQSEKIITALNSVEKVFLQ